MEYKTLDELLQGVFNHGASVGQGIVYDGMITQLHAKQAIQGAIERAKATTETHNSDGMYPIKPDAIQGFRDNLWKELGIDTLPLNAQQDKENS